MLSSVELVTPVSSISLDIKVVGSPGQSAMLSPGLSRSYLSMSCLRYGDHTLFVLNNMVCMSYEQEACRPPSLQGVFITIRITCDCRSQSFTCGRMYSELLHPKPITLHLSAWNLIGILSDNDRKVTCKAVVE